MMVTRVSLLLLVTGLFAGMWSADRPDGQMMAERQQARRAKSARSACNATASSNRLVASSAKIKVDKVPLPRGIAAGTYLVVNQFGVTQRMTIVSTGPNLAQPENFAVVEQYTAHAGDMRWHFIRLDTAGESAPLTPQATAARLP